MLRHLLLSSCTVVATLLLLPQWILAIAVKDTFPIELRILQGALMGVAVSYGFAVAGTRRSAGLAVATVVTLCAYPILFAATWLVLVPLGGGW